MEVRDKVVVITGASSGIGMATAKEFASMGNTVVLAARREDALQRLAQECRQLGGNAMAYPIDVSIEQDVYRLAQNTIDNFGKIDVWVNNAAVSMMGRFEDSPMEDIRRVIDINLFGYVHGAKAVLPFFRKQGYGNLINVSSVVSISGQPYSMAYTTSKFAIRGFSLSLMSELSDSQNIHISTVLPAVIDTPLFNQAANYMGRSVVAPGPAIDAQEVAEAIVSLVREPKTELEVGGVGVMAGVMQTFAPQLFAKQYRKKVYKKHFKNESSEPTKGNLYDPMPQFNSVSGGWKKKSGFSVSTQKVALAGLALAGAIVGASFWFGKKKKEQAQETA